MRVSMTLRHWFARCAALLTLTGVALLTFGGAVAAAQRATEPTYDVYAIRYATVDIALIR
jgi:hypothetical protein